MKEKADIIIACMDRRLNQLVEQKAQASEAMAIVLRNGGADVDNLSKSIAEIASAYDIRSVSVFVHNDCAAMKEIARVKDGAKADYPEISTAAEKYSEHSHGRICEENKNTQLRALEKMFPAASSGDAHTALSAKLVDVSHAPHPDGEKKAAIIIDTVDKSHSNYSSLSERIGADVNNAYFIQYIGRDNIIPDLSLVVKSGIRDVTIFSTDKTLLAATNLLRQISAQRFAASVNLRISETEIARTKVR